MGGGATSPHRCLRPAWLRRVKTPTPHNTIAATKVVSRPRRSRRIFRRERSRFHADGYDRSVQYENCRQVLIFSGQHSFKVVVSHLRHAPTRTIIKGFQTISSLVRGLPLVETARYAPMK